MFHSARIKLTAWYLLLIMCISILFSVAIYSILDRGFEREAQRIEFYYQITPDSPDIIAYPVPQLSLLHKAEEKLKLTLLYINLIILASSAVIGYFLAGKTLNPIQIMVDEQNRFITDASHELRTPITALRSQFEVFIRGHKNINKDFKNLLESSLEEVDNLQNLSNNLLQLAQYQNSIKSAFETLNIKEIIQESIKKIKPMAKVKHITIANNSINVNVKGERQSLIQLFVIILDNAIKYSPNKSKVKIENNLSDRFTFIEIRDEGIGIDKKIIPYIFNRFYRADLSRSKQKTEGYGLGLSIAKRIVEIHKGTISVKSQTSQGTSFIVQLPKSN